MEISQKKFMFGTRHIAVDENKVTVKIEKFNLNNEYSFDIEVLSEHYNRIKKFPYDWLCVIIVATIIDISFVIRSFYAREQLIILVPVMFITIGWIISIVKFWKNSINSILFFNRFDGSVVLELFYNYPSQVEFSDFVEFIKKKISVISEQKKNTQKSFSFELREIVKLKEDGLLDEQEFKILKDKLINKTVESGKIGF